MDIFLNIRILWKTLLEGLLQEASPFCLFLRQEAEGTDVNGCSQK
jgi:hypothetical protein